MPATLLRPRVKSRLERALDGELHTSALWKGIYARDASIYEVEPLGVVVPRSMEDVRRVVEIAGDADLSVLPRGAGTSQAGQSVNRALVVDTSVHLHRVVDLDPRAGVVRVEPGIVLDALNRVLRPHGQFFPVDVATAARATLGGMVGNDSAGARSIRYGTTADHVRAVRTLLADGREAWLPARAGAVPEGFGPVQARIADIRKRVTRQLRTRIPHVPRHVAGYGLHRIGAAAEDLGQLLVGSEGTLGFFTELELSTAPLPERRVLGVCAFRDVRSALAAVADTTALGPSAVELIDRIILDQARAVPGLRERVDRFAAADAGALLVVEFEGADGPEALESLHSLCAERHGWMGWTSALEPALQADVWAVRKTGLNLSMRTSGPRTRIPFIEDCAVPVDRLPEFHDRMVAVFEHHGVSSVFYAHASVGLLHIRPGLDLADPADRVRLREISTETAAIVKDLSGSFSGEHGDGIVRAGAIEPMLGRRLAGAFREVKAAFDPASRFNPGRIVDAPAMDDPALLHAARPLRPSAARPGLEWGDGGVLAMASACNQNGTCRKHDVGTMCPSYRVTRDERHAPRGRANALRLALSGRLGGVSDPDLHAALDLCVGCKACRRECPMQVDVSRLKIEALHQRRRAGHRPRLRTRMFAELPRRAPVLSRLGALQGLLPRTLLGLAAGRRLPRWSRTPFSDAELAEGPPDGRPVVLFVDTFTRWFEPENARAAIRVLRSLRILRADGAGGGGTALLRTHLPQRRVGGRGTGRPAVHARRTGARDRCGDSGGGPGAVLRADVPRRGRGAPAGTGPARTRGAADHGAGAGCTDERLRSRRGAPARTLPREGVRRGRGGGPNAGACPGSGGACTGRRVLRHGRLVRVRGRARCRVPGHGGPGAGSRRPGGRSGHADRGERDELPGTDPGPHRSGGASHDPGVGPGSDEHRRL